MGTSGVASRSAASLFPLTRRSVLRLLFSNPDESFYLRQIVELTGLAVGQVQRELNLLSSCGIISRTEKGRHVYFSAEQSCPIFEELRGIVLKTMGAAVVLGSMLEELKARIRVAFVFGSVARAEETNLSDVDLIVVGDATFAEVAAAARRAEDLLRREVNLVVYPPDEFVAKARAGHSFIQQVLRREKLFTVGDEHELEALLEQPLDP